MAKKGAKTQKKTLEVKAKDIVECTEVNIEYIPVDATVYDEVVVIEEESNHTTEITVDNNDIIDSESIVVDEPQDDNVSVIEEKVEEKNINNRRPRIAPTVYGYAWNGQEFEY